MISDCLEKSNREIGKVERCVVKIAKAQRAKKSQTAKTEQKTSNFSVNNLFQREHPKKRTKTRPQNVKLLSRETSQMKLIYDG